MMAEQTNLALREYTTSIGFSMQLSKRMIDLLVAMHHFKGDFHKLVAWQYEKDTDVRRRAFAHCVTSLHSLENRGLMSPDFQDWSLTKAGHLVVALLKEAGIYQERMKELGMA